MTSAEVEIWSKLERGKHKIPKDDTRNNINTALTQEQTDSCHRKKKEACSSVLIGGTWKKKKLAWDNISLIRHFQQKSFWTIFANKQYFYSFTSFASQPPLVPIFWHVSPLSSVVVSFLRWPGIHPQKYLSVFVRLFLLLAPVQLAEVL